MGIREALISATGTMGRRTGIDGETWTAAELRRMRRAGWLVLNGLPLRYGDVDHIAIGRGWVLALETKWSSQPWDVNGRDERIIDAAAQARYGADRVEKLLGTLGLPVGVRGVVVLWGAVAGELPTKPQVDTAGQRVAIVHGDGLRSFLQDVKPRPHIDEEKIWNALATEIEKRDAYESNRSPEPVSMQSRAIRVGIGMGIGLLFVAGLSSFASRVFGAHTDAQGGTLALGIVGAAWLSMRTWRRYPPALGDIAGGTVLSLAPFLALLVVAMIRSIA